MNREPAYTFERFMHELFQQAMWSGGALTFEDAAKRVREAYPKKKFTRAEFLQRQHAFEKGGV